MPFDSKPQGRSLDDKDKPPPRQIGPRAPGSYDAAAIILLSDGRRPGRAHLRHRPGHRGRRRSHARRHAHLPSTGRTHLARGSTHDRRRVPPCGYSESAAQRLREPRVAGAGADARDGSLGLAGFAVGGVGFAPRGFCRWSGFGALCEDGWATTIRSGRDRMNALMLPSIEAGFAPGQRRDVDLMRYRHSCARTGASVHEERKLALAACQ
jgi:hypothetical protein